MECVLYKRIKDPYRSGNFAGEGEEQGAAEAALTAVALGAVGNNTGTAPRLLPPPPPSFSGESCPTLHVGLVHGRTRPDLAHDSRPSVPSPGLCASFGAMCTAWDTRSGTECRFSG